MAISSSVPSFSSLLSSFIRSLSSLIRYLLNLSPLSLLYIINILFFVFSLTIIIIGSELSASLITSISQQTLSQGYTTIGIYLLIVTGCGLFSLIHPFEKGFPYYIQFHLLFSVILLALSITFFVQYQNNVGANFLSNNWISLSNPSLSAYSQYGQYTLSTIQSTFNCCGRNYYNESYTDSNTNYTIYTGIGQPFASSSSSSSLLPPSCPDPSLVCGSNVGNLQYQSVSDCYPSYGGCLPILISKFQSQYYNVGIVGIVLSCFQIVFNFIICFIQRTRKDIWVSGVKEIHNH